MEPRIIELELRYTEQQRMLQELSDVLYQQQKKIDRLEHELSYLRKRLEAEPPAVVDSGDERPPHY